MQFIPYQMKIQMPNASFKGLYTLQNEATDNTGAISIVGIPETTMTGTIVDGKQSLQHWIMKQPNIFSIEQSDTPRINKWWLIHRKENVGVVQAFVDNKLHSHLKTNYPKHNLDHIQHKYTRQTNTRDPHPNGCLNPTPQRQNSTNPCSKTTHNRTLPKIF